MCLTSYLAQATQLPNVTSVSSAYDNYDWSKEQAYISLHLSNYAYCGHEMYDSLNWAYTSDTAGFVHTKTVYNPDKDTEGFVGYLPSDNSIYVAFRGSSSLANW